MDFNQVYDQMKRAAGALGRAEKVLSPDRRSRVASEESALFHKIDPSLAPDFPLLLSVCGGGNSGKSTLVNSLIGESVAPTGGTAGLTRRGLICGHPELWQTPAFCQSLFHCFPESPKRMECADDLLTPGTPVFVESTRLPRNLLILDTPDFDTGARSSYTNRSLATPILEASHVLIYVFTNANYANKDNTDFLRERLHEIGTREIILVYRVSPALDDETVSRHLSEVAGNLYVNGQADHIKGFYRTDESNEVVAGDESMRLRPVGSSPEMSSLFKSLDPRAIRQSQSMSAVAHFLDEADKERARLDRSREHLEIYRNACLIACGRAVLSSLRLFPQEAILERVQQHYAETAPPLVRYLRTPGKKVRQVTGRVRAWMPKRRKNSDKAVSQELLKSVQSAANEFYRHLCAEQIVTTASLTDPDGRALYEKVRRLSNLPNPEGAPKPSVEGPNGDNELRLTVPRHPAVNDLVQEMQTVNVEERLAKIKEEALRVLKVPENPLTAFDREFDRELRHLVLENRQNLSMIKRFSEYLFALADMGLVSGALTYVVFTGDIVSATAAGSAKVTGLFGLNDLAALLVFPAQAKLGQFERHFLSDLLQKWLNDRVQRVQQIFDRHLSGSFISTCGKRFQEADEALSEVGDALEEIKEEACHVAK